MKSWLPLTLLAAALAGCSGGGNTGCSTSVTPIGGAASGSAGCSSGPVTPVATDLVITVTTNQASGILNTGNDTAKVTVKAVDASRNIVADVPVTIQPDETAIVTPSGSTTDATGTVTGDIGLGNDHSDRTIAVSIVSGTITKVVNIAVTGATLTAAVPAVIQPSATTVVQYHLVDAGGAPMVGVTVSIAGTYSGSGVTDASGNYAFSFTAPATAGQIELDASAAGVSLNSTAIVSTTTSVPPANGTVASSSVAATALTVPVNPQGSQSNSVGIRALFLADHNVPLQNVRVRFDLDGDPNAIGGTMSSGTSYVYSDVNGVALSNYIPGTRSSGSNGVTVRACWDYQDFTAGTCPHQNTVSLTVRGQSVSLNVGTDGKLTDASDSGTSYQQAFSVQVVDSAGNPMVGVLVTYKARPTNYYVGEFTSSGPSWLNPAVDSNGDAIFPVRCLNEDLTQTNNLKDFGAGGTEDQNGDGELTPHAAAITVAEQTPGSAVTNEFGRALFYLQYQKNLSYWIDYLLTFSVSVEGSEGTTTFAGRTAATVDEVKGAGTPPWVVSPYGSNVVVDPVTGIVSKGTVGLTLVTDTADNVSGYLCNAAPTPPQ